MQEGRERSWFQFPFNLYKFSEEVLHFCKVTLFALDVAIEQLGFSNCSLIADPDFRIEV